jgi:hypothetical protein
MIIIIAIMGRPVLRGLGEKRVLEIKRIDVHYMKTA